MNCSIEPHPLLNAVLFISRFSSALGTIEYPQEVSSLLDGKSDAPFFSTDHVRSAIRELLRFGGYKPAGRGKPSSEYLARLGSQSNVPKINLAVDIGNIVSLYSGLPVSVIDFSKINEPVSIKTASPGESYIFNQSGQQIDLTGLICLYDACGPCANAVKDSQRTKTSPTTTTTLNIIWGAHKVSDMVQNAQHWYVQLLKLSGAQVEPITICEKVK